MKYTLLTKKEIEQTNFSERAGMINIYACSNCRKVVIYLYIDSGITPPHIRCDVCSGIAFSQLARMHQPTRYWYRPKNLEEIKTLVDEAYETDKEKYKGQDEALVKGIILDNYVEHYNKGRLFAKSMG